MSRVKTDDCIVVSNRSVKVVYDKVGFCPNHVDFGVFRVEFNRFAVVGYRLSIVTFVSNNYFPC